ncbi:hypothetical protein IWQ60_007945 [Tieghemiomyces parasiticus]|uniref:Cytochrome b561 domain-containing protein n=1 Tax=Tieghemiomyces parasiticus TaxID=78921 RepID=A0A9W8DMQ7_9FUNG|nr:hypothetical protein IWQ60_007945 [Tieghemiomyces parasiticus]
MITTATLVLASLLLATGAQAHEGHHHNANMSFSSDIDTRLWLHVVFMGLAYGVLFPVGTVLGLVKHRFHVPVQSLGFALVVVGYFLGHYHQGRMYGENAHVDFSRLVLLTLFIQVGCGVYLKLHLERYMKRDYLRPIIKAVHRYIGLATTLIAWVQILLGFIALTGFCYADHFGQCLAHFIMGSSFVWYGVWLLFCLTLAGPWLRSKGRSPEFYDSAMILVWGIVNTFTEHRWDEAWNHKDLQHTAMGILWWAGGLVGVVMTWRLPATSRSMVPSLVILFTGIAMGSHQQHTEFSTKFHAYFGGALCIAALTRIIELFLLSSSPAAAAIDDEPIRYGRGPLKPRHPFQYVPTFFLVLSGTLFMSAQEESIQNLLDMGVDPASYGLLIVSVAFILFLVAYSLMIMYRALAPASTDLGYHAVLDSGEDPHFHDPASGTYSSRYAGAAVASTSSATATGIYSDPGAEAHVQTIFDVLESNSSSFDEEDPRSAVTLREEVEMGAMGASRSPHGGQLEK